MAMKGTRISKPNVKISMMISVVLAIAEKRICFLLIPYCFIYPNVITISKYNTYELFDELYYKVYYALCACIGKPACKGYEIKFKFYPDSETINSLSLGKFLLNINAWRPLIELNSLESLEIKEAMVEDLIVENNKSKYIY